MAALGTALLVAGYPLAVAGIARLRRTLRERDGRWMAVEAGGTVAIVAGWTLRGRPEAVAPNAAWLAVLPVLWWWSGRGRPAGGGRRR